jgi:hypothetical protein
MKEENVSLVFPSVDCARGYPEDKRGFFDIVGFHIGFSPK